MALDIRTFGDPVLKTRATPVEDFDESLARLTQDMLATMRDREGVGLAANQVGRLKRVLVAATEDEEYAVVNPVIETSARKVASPSPASTSTSNGRPPSPSRARIPRASPSR